MAVQGLHLHRTVRGIVPELMYTRSGTNQSILFGPTRSLSSNYHSTGDSAVRCMGFGLTGRAGYPEVAFSGSGFPRRLESLSRATPSAGDYFIEETATYAKSDQVCRESRRLRSQGRVGRL